MAVVLICGGGGQLGTALRRQRWPEGVEIAAPSRRRIDLARRETIARCLEDLAPALVINAAAYTAVDRAESDVDAAMATNAEGPRFLGECARARDIPVVHVSSDYVFDGGKRTPYREDDAPAPLGVYGRSKAEGERALGEAQPRHVILRTSWLFSPYGANFVCTMLRLGRINDELRVVADRQGCPTPAHDLAAAIVAIAQRIAAGAASWGVYHYCGAGVTTWAGFAEAIFDAAAPRLGRRPRIVPISADDRPTAAGRPAYSVLGCTKIARDFGVRQRGWRDGLEATVTELLDSDRAA